MIKPNIKHSIKLVGWTMFSVVIGVSLAFVSLSAFDTINSSQNINTITENAFQDSTTASKIEISKYFYINNDTNGDGPRVAAKAYLVGDINTGEIILAKNQDKKIPLASVSKLMTALITKKTATEDEVTKITKAALATEGKNGELILGEKIKVLDLLYPLLMESSNDAAEALALHFGRENFIAKMNQEAANLQLTSTSYEDPSGLTPYNLSTVSDMFKLTGYIIQNEPEIFDITTKRSYSLKKHSWYNISQFLWKSGYFGGKSGYTGAAKQTVISLFNLPLGKTSTRPIAIILLQSPDRGKDVNTILGYLKKNVYYGGEADANTNWVQEKVRAPGGESNYIKLAFVGDMMLDRGVRNSLIKNFNSNYSYLFDKSKNLLNILSDSDIFFANLEGPVSDQGTDQKNLFSFRMDPSVIPALKGIGLSIVSLANNHMGDWGRLAFIDTMSRLTENEILYTGGGKNKVEATSPTIIEKNGMKIGFLGFSDKGPQMTAGVDTAGILLASDSNFAEIIKNAAKQVDYLIVAFHFGEEYQANHNARQEELAHRAVDNGAKIVIGSHPHVVEDMEVYKNGYITYSLGNFIFDQSWSSETMHGILLEIKLFKDGSMTVTKNPTEQNSVFQIEKVTEGDEIRVKF